MAVEKMIKGKRTFEKQRKRCREEMQRDVIKECKVVRLWL